MAKKPKTLVDDGGVRKADAHLDGLDAAIAKTHPEPFPLSRDDLTLVQAALPFFAMAARSEAAIADMRLVESRKVAELAANDHLRRQADRAMALRERLDDYLNHNGKAR